MDSLSGLQPYLNQSMELYLHLQMTSTLTIWVLKMVMSIHHSTIKTEQYKMTKVKEYLSL